MTRGDGVEGERSGAPGGPWRADVDGAGRKDAAAGRKVASGRELALGMEKGGDLREVQHDLVSFTSGTSYVLGGGSDSRKPPSRAGFSCASFKTLVATLGRRRLYTLRKQKRGCA